MQSCPPAPKLKPVDAVPMWVIKNNSTVVQQVVDAIGRPLTFKEHDKVSEMIKEGFTIRQMVSQVNYIAAIEKANERRVRYAKEIKKIGGPLPGVAVETLKKVLDQQDGVVLPWEEAGYPCGYKMELPDPKTKKKQLKTNAKKKSEAIQKYKEKQSKAIEKSKKKQDKKIKEMQPVVDQEFLDNFKQKYKNQGPSCMQEVD